MYFAVSESDFAMMKFILTWVKRLRCDSCGPPQLSASWLVLYTLYFVSIIITYKVFSNTCKDTYDNVFGKYGIAWNYMPRRHQVIFRLGSLWCSPDDILAIKITYRVTVCIFSPAFSLVISSGADPGEVKWVNFHPPFLSPLLSFFLMPQISK